MPHKDNQITTLQTNQSDRFGRKPRWMSGMAALILRSKTLERQKALAK